MRAGEPETWLIAIDPEAGATAMAVIALAYRGHRPLRFKETCFGLLAEGEREAVRQFIAELRARRAPGLFFKRKGHSIADTRICADTFERRGLRRMAVHLRHNNRS